MITPQTFFFYGLRSWPIRLEERKVIEGKGEVRGGLLRWRMGEPTWVQPTGWVAWRGKEQRGDGILQEIHGSSIRTLYTIPLP